MITQMTKLNVNGPEWNMASDYCWYKLFSTAFLYVNLFIIYAEMVAYIFIEEIMFDGLPVELRFGTEIVIWSFSISECFSLSSLRTNAHHNATDICPVFIFLCSYSFILYCCHWEINHIYGKHRPWERTEYNTSFWKPLHFLRVSHMMIQKHKCIWLKMIGYGELTTSLYVRFEHSTTIYSLICRKPHLIFKLFSYSTL